FDFLFPGKPGFTKKQADLFFPPDFADDFPVAMQVMNRRLPFIPNMWCLLQLNNLELAVSLAKRGNLPGAENLVDYKFPFLK
ncbi:hypothetical protein BHM03_00051844, partial [Ensete ventricosum]